MGFYKFFLYYFDDAKGKEDESYGYVVAKNFDNAVQSLKEYYGAGNIISATIKELFYNDGNVFDNELAPTEAKNFLNFSDKESFKCTL